MRKLRTGRPQTGGIHLADGYHLPQPCFNCASSKVFSLGSRSNDFLHFLVHGAHFCLSPPKYMVIHGDPSSSCCTIIMQNQCGVSTKELILQRKTGRSRVFNHWGTCGDFPQPRDVYQLCLDVHLWYKVISKGMDLSLAGSIDRLFPSFRWVNTWVNTWSWWINKSIYPGQPYTHRGRHTTRFRCL